MPLFVYRCPDCGDTVELRRPASERDNLPDCDLDPWFQMERVPTAATYRIPLPAITPVNPE